MEGPRHEGSWHEERPAWRDDVALELWVDADRTPVRVRLAGTLNETTSHSLVSVVAETIEGGVRRLVIDTAGLRTVDPFGEALLVVIEGMVARSGGTVSFEGGGAGVETGRGTGPSALAGR
jgi:hypothetical protein